MFDHLTHQIEKNVNSNHIVNCYYVLTNLKWEYNMQEDCLYLQYNSNELLDSNDNTEWIAFFE